MTPDQERNNAEVHDLASVADELHRESERLRRLAEELKARDEVQAEMQANYPHFKKALYALLRERFERELPPLPDEDLETFAAAQNAQPLEAFIGMLERNAAC
jgi:hypothetical protein